MTMVVDLSSRAAYEAFSVPDELIAQHPARPRDSSRLMVVHRSTGCIEHKKFSDLPEVLRADGRKFSLVLNNSGVRDCLLDAVDAAGAKHVVYLLEEATSGVGPSSEGNDGDRAAKRPRADRPAWMCSGETLEKLEEIGKQSSDGIAFRAAGDAGLEAYIRRVGRDGLAEIEFRLAPGRPAGDGGPAAPEATCLQRVEAVLRTPLPPYVLSRDGEDQYDTVFAKDAGSVAAPTAGLHFTEDTLRRCREDAGCTVDEVTLHVGYGTFAHIEADALSEHKMHAERLFLSESTAARLEGHVSSGRALLAVGTTATRTLETCAAATPKGEAARFEPTGASGKQTELFIYPDGHDWRAVGALLTNFHMPGLTPICLVASFAGAQKGGTYGYDLVMRAYKEAIRERYRFFSFGDAMLVL